MMTRSSLKLLIVNAGSSSLKLRTISGSDDVVAAEDLDAVPSDGLEAVLSGFVERAGRPDAVVHRIVHGGDRYQEPTLLDTHSDQDLESLSELAPLHNPQAVAAVRAMRRVLPDVDEVGCFDTSFHATLPPAAATYALPQSWNERFGLRRFGFHGLSHSWAARRAAELLGRPPGELHLVTAHIGAGASLCAVAGGRSVDTTMGFTPTEGLVMATRPGNVDPGLVLWLQHHGGVSTVEMERVFADDSGLKGLSGVSGDLRKVFAAADGGGKEALLAYEVYVHRLRGLIAMMAAAMGGMDGLVFTGGAGEGSSRLREDACSGLQFLGVQLDARLNETKPADDVVISPRDAPAATMVVAAREDLEMARQARLVLSESR